MGGFSDYTSESVAAYTAAYNEAVAVNENVQSTQSEIDAALKKLQNASNALEKKVSLSGYSLCLAKNIGLNFHLTLSNEVLSDSGAKVQLTLPNGTVQEIPVNSVTNDGNGYKFTAKVSAKEMTSDITATVILSDGTTSGEYRYTIKQYADTIL